MKKTRLSGAFDYDFELIGIVSNVREHKLAWFLNKQPFFHFIKKKDIKIEFADDSSILISNYVSKKQFHQYTLLKNRLVFSNQPKLQFILPELQRFDYLLKFNILVDSFDVDHLISSIKNIPVVDYTSHLDLSRIKQKENLLYYD